MTSTKTVMLLALLMIFTASTSAYYFGDTGSNSITGDTGFSIPEYDSQGEIMTQFVAPFLLIALILQVGLERALRITLADDSLKPKERKREIKQNRKRSVILALVITGMIVPTTFFQHINNFTAIIFGSIGYLLLLAIMVAFLLILKNSFFSGGGG